jgi:transposase
LGEDYDLTRDMPRSANMPNAENCSIGELDIAAQAAISRRSHVRLMAMKALLMGVARTKVAEIFGVCMRTLSSWIGRFNEAGIDGLIEQERCGRPRKITHELSALYEELIEYPELANEAHWTGKKFHGYLTKELEFNIGYRSVVRWLHRLDFRLKIPRRWPNGQDPEKREAFLELLKAWFADLGIDLWFQDETGIEGDPRPRARWAKKGKKIRQPYQGTHTRMSATGVICPRTGEFYALMIPSSNTQIFQIFLDNANADLVFERPRNLLILDNASWHKSKSLNWGRFEPVHLPPYSPDLNPIERLWDLMKGEWFTDFYAKSREELTNRLIDALNWIIDRKELNKKTCGIPTKL